MRRLVLVLAALLAACEAHPTTVDGAAGYTLLSSDRACDPVQESAPCIAFYDIENIPGEWPCGSGPAIASQHRPDHLQCVECWPVQAEWCVAPDDSTCVRDCQNCVPKELLALDKTTRCEAAGWLPAWEPRDMTIF